MIYMIDEVPLGASYTTPTQHCLNAENWVPEKGWILHRGIDFGCF
jgi:hypothetical protein